ncbi:hypothetical protein KIN20_035883 [Parelaphostrongylus tenuis]|uniref:Legumain n=1 Tax=Parelaphostrongylus tenuis TaxID=148309 RepID=A0AAD5WKA4_PARTN|nr:hypothetical protein KIN20_035883 [Parelaphostrongylus tenuis]
MNYRQIKKEIFMLYWLLVHIIGGTIVTRLIDDVRWTLPIIESIHILENSSTNRTVLMSITVLKIDYTGYSVTPDNFLNVLQGKAEEILFGGDKRVLNTTADDRIFVYFTDHGGQGLIAFPEDILSKHDLAKALQNMHKEKRYKELVFYLEACESGSMFDGILNEEMNIYAMTASNEHESSWATYCDEHEEMPCLGDLFSVNWMEDSEQHNIGLETLLTQYIDVKNKTDKSHVMKYGNFNITKEVVDEFEGDEYHTATASAPPTRSQSATSPAPTMTHSSTASTTTHSAVDKQHSKVSWPARDVELMHLEKLQKTASNTMTSLALQQRIATIHEDRTQH